MLKKYDEKNYDNFILKKKIPYFTLIILGETINPVCIIRSVVYNRESTEIKINFPLHCVARLFFIEEEKKPVLKKKPKNKGSSQLDKLEALKKLFDDGLITPEEFLSRKKIILNLFYQIIFQSSCKNLRHSSYNIS